MKIGILQIDGKLPNLALMKIAAYHENRGDTVGWYDGALFSTNYDRIYASTIFDFSRMPALPSDAIVGGTGIDHKNRLPKEIESCQPSYSLYKTPWRPYNHIGAPIAPCDYHIGFSMKGCRFSWSFCVVPTKEGKPYKYNSIDEILTNPKGGKRLVLLDNDFFGTGDWEVNLKRIVELNLKVNFNQGLNIRILTQRQANLLATCKYYNLHFTKRYLTFAWDRYEDREDIMKGIERCDIAGIRRDHLQFFVLIGYDTTPEQDLNRVETIRSLGAMPFVMPYNKFDQYQKEFSRWANSRQLKHIKWQDYIHNFKPIP